jgi:hypothetical protein
MKKLFFLSLIIVASSASVFAQQEKVAAPSVSFTKAELLAFKNLKELLSAINKGQDYSTYLVRNFHLATTVKNSDGTETKLSEMGPGGTWSEKQKNMIEKQAAKGAVFTLENMVLIEQGKKGVINQPNISFLIKE